MRTNQPNHTEHSVEDDGVRAVERVVADTGELPTAIGHLTQIAIVIVGIGLRLTE